MNPEPRTTVVFVCEFGSKKSVLAACYFERLARARGSALRATSRGLTPDPEIPPRVRDGLRREGIEVGSLRPQALSPSDLDAALAVVSFAPELHIAEGEGPPPRFWTDVPALSEAYELARNEIQARTERLLEELLDGELRDRS